MLAILCQSPVLMDFMLTEVADARRMYREAMRNDDWADFFSSRQRVITGLDQYSESSVQKMGSNVFKVLVDVGYLESARNKPISLPRPLLFRKSRLSSRSLMASRRTANSC